MNFGLSIAKIHNENSSLFFSRSLLFKIRKKSLTLRLDLPPYSLLGDVHKIKVDFRYKF